MTGIRVLFWIFRTRLLLPLGITRSMYWSNSSSAETSARVWMACMYALGIEVFARAVWIAFESSCAVSLLSLPPFNMAALPKRNVSIHHTSILKPHTRLDRQSSDVDHDLWTSFEYDQEHADRTSDAVELEVIVQLRCIGDTARGIRELCDVCHTL